MPSQLTNGPAVAIHMYQALYGKAPSNGLYNSYLAQATNDPSGFASDLTASFVNTSDANLALLVLTNLGVTASTIPADSYAVLLSALEQMFTGYGVAARGQIILNATNLLANLEGDATYGAAATTYNNQAVANLAYSSDSANTQPGLPTIPDANVGQTYTLTASADNIVGTQANDTITGIFGAADNGDNTYNVGDIIDGGNGDDVLSLIAQENDAAATATATVTNVETINIRDVFGATFDAALVSSSPAINFTSTLAGQPSTVDNGSAASAISISGNGDLVVNDAATSTTFGLNGKGDLTVDFTTTTGTTDTAKLSLGGAGTSATVRSTVDVSDGSTIEAVTIATSGTNYVDLVAGTGAATVTVTGDGTNDISMANLGDVAAISTIDASASTGTNTFSVGSNLNTTDTVKGGTGADTLVATFGLATLLKPTLTGVETLKADFDTAATLDLSSATGLTTVTLDGAAADATIMKAKAEVETLNITSSAAAQDVNFAYNTTTKGDLTVNIGTTASTAANIDLGAGTFTNTASFALNTVGTKVYDFDSIDLNGDQSAISIAANADLTTGGIDVTVGDVGSFDVTVGADTSYSGGLYLSKGDLGDVTYSVAAGADGQIYLETDEGSIGNVTITGEGQANMGIAVSGGGSLGDITIDLTGADASGSYFGAIVSGGSIGDISISVADYANIDFDISGNAYQFGDTDENGTDGNIGNVTITVGDNSYVSGNIQASGGDIGNVSVTVDGVTASGNLDVHAIFLSGDMDSDTSADDYVRGGNVGNISLSITGEDASFTMDVGASGGNVGNVDFSVTGDGASGWLGVQATAYGSGSPGGNIGDVTFNVGDNADAELGLNFDLTIGTIDVTVGDGSSAGMYVSGGSSGAAVLSDITVDIGADSHYIQSVSGFGGDVGDTTVTAGAGADIQLNFASVSGSIGDISITAGDDSSGNVWMSGNAGDIGDITMTLGDNSDANVEFYNISGGVSIGNIDITVGDDSSAWVYFSGGASGAIGATTFVAGAGSDVYYGHSGGNNDGIGGITVIGGDDTSTAEITLAAGTKDGGFGGVDGSAWNGYMDIDLSAVTTGTTIMVGADGSDVVGTQGSDNIFGGAGIDTIVLSATSSLDEIFSFQKAKDIVDLGQYTDNATETAIAADAADVSLTDGSAYVFATGADGTDAEAIADYEDLADVGAFLAAAFNDEATGANFVAVINDGGASAYVYNVVYDNGNNGGGAIDADAITLIGIINADGALTVANVVGS